MKKTNYFILMVAIIFASCSSNEGIGTAIDENLPEIAKKLKKLEASLINEDNSSQFKISSNKKRALSKNSFLKKRIQNKQVSNCQHEVVVEDYSYEDFIYKVTERYFTKDGNKATNCDLENLVNDIEKPPFSLKYIVERDIIQAFDNYYFTIFSKIKNEESVKVNSLTSMSLTIKSEADLTGTLTFDNSLFYLLEGSEINILLETTFGPNDDLEEILSEDDLTMDLKYIIGFEVNQSGYHFDMLLNYKDMVSLEENESDLTIEYNLLNADDKKIGTINYILDYQTEKEYFTLYDLDGNLVE